VLRMSVMKFSLNKASLQKEKQGNDLVDSLADLLWQGKKISSSSPK